jgi:uridine monophosphate synthetase
MSVLVHEGKIGMQAAEKVTAWLQSNPTQLSSFVLDQNQIASNDRIIRKPFAERRIMTSNKLASKIFDIMARKQSNLCLAVDFDKVDQVLAIADSVGEHIAILKLHADILSDFSENFVHELQSLAQKHDFILFEDRKFADIGNTVRLQYSQGVHRIVQWADLVTCHVTPGDGVVQGLKACLSGNEGRGCVLVAEMSSAGHLLKQDAVQAACFSAETHPDFVVGFICQNRITCNPRLIHMTPGVSFDSGSDSLGQRYLSPEQAIENGADVVIIGRAVTAAGDTAAQVQAAKRFKETAYQSYLKQCC